MCAWASTVCDPCAGGTGADGFGFAPGPAGWEKVCQLGGVRLGDRVEIGACTTVDRGTLGHTEIADGVIIDNLVQVAQTAASAKIPR